MVSLHVKNFRSFDSLEELDIRPITLLLGRNSSGKSTVTRIIPLIQQTIEARSSAPVLWYGKLVDFGSYADCVPKWNKGASISVGFTIEAESFSKVISRLGYGPNAIRYNKIIKASTDVKYVADLVERKERTFLKGFSVELNGDRVSVEITEQHSVGAIHVNGRDYTHYYGKNSSVDDTSLVPRINIIEKFEGTRITYDVPDTLILKRRDIIDKFLHHRMSPGKKDLANRRVEYASKGVFESDLPRLLLASDYTNRIILEKIREGSPDLEELRRISILFCFGGLLSCLDQAIRQIFSRSAYIGPSRASGERYYRWQELAVDQIDPKGENFAMYLMSLSERELANFSALVRESFGYDVKADRSAGNASIMIRENETSEWYNIADVGYGFSQVLPVIGQIHASLANRRRPFVPTNDMSDRIVAIEQPELHLHPAYQARLADLFEKTIYRRGDRESERALSGVKILAETHSETLLNRMGELVECGRISSDDIAVYIFEKENNQKPTSIRQASFRSDGSLTDWPLGFFFYS